MTEPQAPMDTLPMECLADKRRCGVRYLCHIKALYNQGQDAGQERHEETWNMARIIDVSARGIGLTLQRHLIPGTMLSLAPLIQSWNPEWVLTVRVTNLRPGPKHSWRAGCEFTQPLTESQLRVLLQNSR